MKFSSGPPTSGKSKWGLSKWGLKVLVHNCPRLPTIVVILRRKFSSERGPKRPQKCTIVDDCAQIAESGLKPPFESPHLDFPDHRGPIFCGEIEMSRLKLSSEIKNFDRDQKIRSGSNFFDRWALWDLESCDP